MTRLRWFVSLLAPCLLALTVEVGAEGSAPGYDTPAAVVAVCPPPDELRDQNLAGEPPPGGPPPRRYLPPPPFDLHQSLRPSVRSDYDIRAPPPSLQ
jgi:hypothetical protein